jgi:hypothetical protein
MNILFLVLAITIRARDCHELKSEMQVNRFSHEFLVSGVPRDFQAAERFCQDWGGNLASIASYEEEHQFH